MCALVQLLLSVFCLLIKGDKNLPILLIPFFGIQLTMVFGHALAQGMASMTTKIDAKLYNREEAGNETKSMKDIGILVAIHNIISIFFLAASIKYPDFFGEQMRNCHLIVALCALFLLYNSVFRFKEKKVELNFLSFDSFKLRSIRPCESINSSKISEFDNDFHLLLSLFNFSRSLVSTA